MLPKSRYSQHYILDFGLVFSLVVISHCWFSFDGCKYTPVSTKFSAKVSHHFTPSNVTDFTLAVCVVLLTRYR